MIYNGVANIYKINWVRLRTVIFPRWISKYKITLTTLRGQASIQTMYGFYEDLPNCLQSHLIALYLLCASNLILCFNNWSYAFSDNWNGRLYRGLSFVLHLIIQWIINNSRLIVPWNICLIFSFYTVEVISWFKLLVFSTREPCSVCWVLLCNANLSNEDAADQ